jgi:hypothetical protein
LDPPGAPIGGGGDSMPIEIMLCSRVPQLLGDMETRFWKYMHRLRNGLGLAGEDAASEGGQDELPPCDAAGGTAGLHAAPYSLRTLVPGAGVTEAVMICALRRAAAFRRQQSFGSGSSDTGSSDADVFQGMADALSEHLLRLLLNSGMRLEPAMDALARYLVQVGSTTRPVLGLLFESEALAVPTRKAMARAAWEKMRTSMPPPLLSVAFRGLIGESQLETVADDRVARWSALTAAARYATRMGLVDSVLTNHPLMFR